VKAREVAAILMEDPDREVVLAGDPEGNYYRPCSAASPLAYYEVTREVLLEPGEPLPDGYGEEDVAKEPYTRAFVLWPL
jgi:hypothetical protein